MVGRINVAIGVILNATKDQVLISKRSNKQHLSGLWEFPGGKVETDETIQCALYRELYEELGISVKHATMFKKIDHDYEDKQVCLHAWYVYDWSGEISACEDQKLIWVPINDLNNYAFPLANRYIIAAVSLPSSYLISLATYDETSYLLSKMKDYFSLGLRLFQLRLTSRQDYHYSYLVDQLIQLARDHQAKLIVNGTPSDIEDYDIDGIHLNSKALFSYSERPIDKRHILGASCHNHKEIMQAERILADYIFISPVMGGSIPEKVPLGWEKFRSLSNKTDIPAYALGGMSPEDKSTAQSFGAHGIAMIRAVWHSEHAVRFS